jgi:hypothetical protein
MFVLTPGHDDIRDETDIFKLVKLIHASRWYPESRPEKPSPATDLLPVFKVNGRNKEFRATLKKLKHGRSVDLQCLFVSFGYSASKDIEIEYRVLSDNIPSIEEGTICVHVRER